MGLYLFAFLFMFSTTINLSFRLIKRFNKFLLCETTKHNCNCFLSLIIELFKIELRAITAKYSSICEDNEKL